MRNLSPTGQCDGQLGDLVSGLGSRVRKTSLGRLEEKQVPGTM